MDGAGCTYHLWIPELCGRDWQLRRRLALSRPCCLVRLVRRDVPRLDRKLSERCVDIVSDARGRALPRVLQVRTWLGQACALWPWQAADEHHEPPHVHTAVILSLAFVPTYLTATITTLGLIMHSFS